MIARLLVAWLASSSVQAAPTCFESAYADMKALARDAYRDVKPLREAVPFSRHSELETLPPCEANLAPGRRFDMKREVELLLKDIEELQYGPSLEPLRRSNLRLWLDRDLQLAFDRGRFDKYVGQDRHARPGPFFAQAGAAARPGGAAARLDTSAARASIARAQLEAGRQQPRDAGAMPEGQGGSRGQAPSPQRVGAARPGERADLYRMPVAVKIEGRPEPPAPATAPRNWDEALARTDERQNEVEARLEEECRQHRELNAGALDRTNMTLDSVADGTQPCDGWVGCAALWMPNTRAAAWLTNALVVETASDYTKAGLMQNCMDPARRRLAGRQMNDRVDSGQFAAVMMALGTMGVPEKQLLSLGKKFGFKHTPFSDEAADLAAKAVSREVPVAERIAAGIGAKSSRGFALLDSFPKGLGDNLFGFMKAKQSTSEAVTHTFFQLGQGRGQHIEWTADPLARAVKIYSEMQVRKLEQAYPGKKLVIERVTAWTNKKGGTSTADHWHGDGDFLTIGAAIGGPPDPRQVARLLNDRKVPMGDIGKALDGLKASGGRTEDLERVLQELVSTGKLKREDAAAITESLKVRGTEIADLEALGRKVEQGDVVAFTGDVAAQRSGGVSVVHRSPDVSDLKPEMVPDRVFYKVVVRLEEKTAPTNSGEFGQMVMQRVAGLVGGK